MRTRRDRKNNTGMLPHRLETSIHGLEVLQHSRSELCTDRRGDLRTLLGTSKVQILHHRTPGPHSSGGSSTTPGNTERNEGSIRVTQPQADRIQPEDRLLPTIQAGTHTRDQEFLGGCRIKIPGGRLGEPNGRGGGNVNRSSITNNGGSTYG